MNGAAHDSAHRWLDRASDAVRNTGHHPLPTDPSELYEVLGVLVELTHRLDSLVLRLASRYNDLNPNELRSDAVIPATEHVAAVVSVLHNDSDFAHIATNLGVAHSAASHLTLNPTPEV